MKDDYKRLKWREKKLCEIHKLGVELVSKADRQKLLERIAESAIDIADAEEVALFIMDPNTKELRLKANKKKK